MDRNRDSGRGWSICYEIGMVYVGVTYTSDVLKPQTLKTEYW